MVKNNLGVIVCFLLAGCTGAERIVVRGPTPGIEYRNQTTAPCPWISVVPSERALALKTVDFEAISNQLHFDMSFEPHLKAMQDVRIVLLDYTVLPPEINKGKNRPERYFMVASFYKIGKSPPCPPDFEVTATLRTDIARPQEAMRFMAGDIVEELRTLSDSGLLTPGRKITVNLD